MSSAIIKADAGWFAIFAVPGKPWTTNRLPVLAWRVEACEASGDGSPIAEPVTVAGNGVLSQPFNSKTVRFIHAATHSLPQRNGWPISSALR